MKALVCRFGGIGDAVILTPIIKKLSERYEVDYAVPEHQVSLFDNLDFIKNIFPTKRYPPHLVDVIPHEWGWQTIDNIKPYYDFVVDYKYSVERNTMYASLAEFPKPAYGDWFSSQNSNYQNWVDLSFGWANIDPLKIPDDEKRPIYKLKQKEINWAKKYTDNELNVGIQLQASSLCRTWYHAERLPSMILKKFPDANVFIYDNRKWILLKSSGSMEIKLPNDPIRYSVALISQMECFISADSGMSHLAEAVNKKSIVIYTTVPAWTRMKYYKYCYPIEAGVECSPCFTLNRYCPEYRKNVDNILTDREKKIKNAAESGQDPNRISLELNTNVEGIIVEWEAIQKKIQGYLTRVPECVKSISPEMILEKLIEIVGK